MVLVLDAVKKTYRTSEGPLEVLKGVSLTLAAGRTMALTGESGSGKSTLLHLAGGLDSADAGKLCVDGEDIDALDDKGRARLRRGTVGLIFQQFNLIPIAGCAGQSGVPRPAG